MSQKSNKQEFEIHLALTLPHTSMSLHINPSVSLTLFCCLVSRASLGPFRDCMLSSTVLPTTFSGG